MAPPREVHSLVHGHRSAGRRWSCATGPAPTVRRGTRATGERETRGPSGRPLPVPVRERTGSRARVGAGTGEPGVGGDVLALPVPMGHDQLEARTRVPAQPGVHQPVEARPQGEAGRSVPLEAGAGDGA